jgi:hypothetical protein
MKKIVLILTTLFVLNSCSKDNTDTPATPEVPVTSVLPKTINKDGVIYNYEYDGNKIKSYTNANKTQQYQYTYTGDFITKYSRIQDPTTLSGFEYNFTYETSNFQSLNSYKYSFYTNTYSSIFTAAFSNNTFSVDAINKSNTSEATSPYDANIVSAPFYTTNNNGEIITVVTSRKNMPPFTVTSNDVVVIKKTYEYDNNDAHKNPFANVTGMNKLSFYDPILVAKHNVSNITTTYSSMTNSWTPVVENMHYDYVYNDAGYPTQINTTPAPGPGNPTVTKITY